jgi:Fe-S-cluster containining protein
MNNKPWYSRGLRFQCTGCGDCCTGAPGYVWVNKAEIEALAAFLHISVEEFQQRYVRQVGMRKSLIELAGGDCVFFDPDRRICQVYAARPRQCRTWPFWLSNLASEKTWRQIADACPGCNHGPIIAPAQIEAQWRSNSK